MPDFVPKGLSVIEPKAFVPKGLRKEIDFAPQEPLSPDVEFGAEILGLGSNAYDGLTAPEAETKANEVWGAAIDSGISLDRTANKLPEVKEFNKRKQSFKSPSYVPGTGMGFTTSPSSYDFGADVWGTVKEWWPNVKIGTVGIGASTMASLKAFMIQLSSAYGTVFPDDAVLHQYSLIKAREDIEVPEGFEDVDAVTRAAPKAPEPALTGKAVQMPQPFEALDINRPVFPGAIASEALAVVTRTPDILRTLLQQKQARMIELLPELRYADTPIMAASRRVWQDGIPSMGTAVAVTLATGSPSLGLLTLGAIAKGGSFQTQIEGGGSILKASVISDLTMASEVLTEQLVFPKLIKGIKGGFTIGGALTLIGENALQEGVAGFNETFLETTGLLTSKGVSYQEAASVGVVEGIKAVPESMLVGAGTVGVTVTTAAAAKTVLQTLKRNSKGVTYSPQVREMLDTRAEQVAAKEAKVAEQVVKPPEAPAKPITKAKPPVTPKAEIKAPEAAPTPAEGKVFFHGTARPDGGVTTTEQGLTFVSPSKEAATFFAKEASKGQADKGKVTVQQVSVTAENTLDVDNKADISKVMDKVDWTKLSEASKKPLLEGRNVPQEVLEDPAKLKQWAKGNADVAYELMEMPEVISAAKALGFDSVSVREAGDKNLAVFDPSQVSLTQPPTPKAEGKKGQTQQEAFDAFKKNIPNAPESQIVNMMIEDGLRPPDAVLERNAELQSVKDLLADEKIEAQAAGFVARKAKPVEVKIPARPLVNPKASALQQDKQLKKQQAWDKKYGKGKLPGGRQAGALNVEALQAATDKMLSILEPAKLAQREVGKDVTASVIKAAHRADVARIEFNEKEFDNLEGTVQQWGEKLGEYSEKVQNLLMLSRGTPASNKAKNIQTEALKQLKKEAPELVGTREMINRVADFNYDFLTDVVGDKVGYVEDYFYGVYKDPAKVSNLLDYWKTTDKFTKQKKWPTYADAKAFDPDIELRNPNPVENLKAEYLGIARLSGMVDLKNSLEETGEFMKGSDVAPPDWEVVHDPVFDGQRVSPSLARMINSLISTNKITRQPTLNTIRKANNLLRNLKFIGSLFHLGVIVEQSIVDTGIREVLLDPTAGLKAFTTLGFKKSDPIFNTPEYKQYIENGGGHRYSIESDAQKSFRQAVNKMNKAGSTAVKGIGLPITIAERITEWMFESYIPKIKYMKYLSNVRVQEQKLKRSLTDAEHQEIIKEGQNFYGEMNERIFGRSGTMTTLLRFKFMAPGWFEGNLRTVLKAATQWGQSGSYNAHRSRRNIVNALAFGTMVATVGTLIMTGKPPKRPEKLEDIPDLFKIDTGKVDAKGNKIMIDTMKTAKDYWLLTGNIVKGVGPFIGDAFKRFGGMTAVTWDVMSDINQMSQGKAVYDWKGDRVVEITDPFIERVMKLALHELEKAEPIPLSVFQQARQKGMDTMLAAAMSLAGVRLTKTEQAKREQEVMSKIFSLRDQQERLYYFLGTQENPRKAVRDYNATVMRILDNPNVPPDFREEYEEKLIIDVDRLVSNKVYSMLSEQATVAEKLADPKSTHKEIKEHNKSIAKQQKWLENLKVPPSEYRRQVEKREMLQRKLIKEIKPEDLREDLKTDLAKFYTEKTFLNWAKRSDDISDTREDKRLTINALDRAISKIAGLIYDTTDASERSGYFDDIEGILEGAE